MLLELRWIANMALTVWQSAIDTHNDPEDALKLRKQMVREIGDHASAGINAADDGARRLAGRLEDIDMIIDDLDSLATNGKTMPMAEIVGRLKRAASGGGWTRG